MYSVNLQSMEEFDEEQILDLPEEKKKKDKEYFYLRIASIGLLCIGTLFRLMHWPFSSLILLAGGISWTIWTIVFLINLERPRIYQWAYSIGRVAVIIGVVLILLLRKSIGLYFFGFATLCFLTGIMASFFDKKER